MPQRPQWRLALVCSWNAPEVAVSRSQVSNTVHEVYLSNAYTFIKETSFGYTTQRPNSNLLPLPACCSPNTRIFRGFEELKPATWGELQGRIYAAYISSDPEASSGGPLVALLPATRTEWLEAPRAAGLALRRRSDSRSSQSL
jgi:hypothetical protein